MSDTFSTADEHLDFPSRQKRNRDLIDVEVSEALAALRNKYPGQKVRISVVFAHDGPAEFFALVEHLSIPFDSQTEFGYSAHAAVERLIARAGEHNQEDVRQIKIAQLEDELASLRRGLESIGAELASLRRGLESIGAVPMGDKEPAGQHEGYGHHEPTAP